MPDQNFTYEESIVPADVGYREPPPELQNLTEEQIQQVIADSLIKDLRERRNALLFETDWTQNPDVPQATKDKWADYRQQLRDITINYSSLNGVVWPEPPQ